MSLLLFVLLLLLFLLLCHYTFVPDLRVIVFVVLRVPAFCVTCSPCAYIYRAHCCYSFRCVVLLFSLESIMFSSVVFLAFAVCLVVPVLYSCCDSTCVF